MSACLPSSQAMQTIHEIDNITKEKATRGGMSSVGGAVTEFCKHSGDVK